MTYVKRLDALEIVKRTSGDYATAWCNIKNLPNEDVVKVTRCKKCDHYNSKINLCKLFQIYFTPEHFCSDGEPKGSAE